VTVTGESLPPDIPCAAAPWHGRKPGMITICKAILSGSTPAQIQEQAEGLVPDGPRYPRGRQRSLTAPRLAAGR
jgi:hypothetical protein